MSAKWTIQIMRIIGQLRLILMDMGHRLMTYTAQLIPKIISNILHCGSPYMLEYKLDGIWTTLLFGDEVAQVMMWQGEVATHVGPTLLNLGPFHPKNGPTKSPNTC
jgi:hypothetical protein